MGQDLKARLRRYRDTGKAHAEQETARNQARNPSRARNSGGVNTEVSWPGWVEAGFKTLKRVVSRELSLPLPLAFIKSLPILVPDFFRLGRLPSPGELLFFDLETTGLSGGAGTVTFLAAFGRFDIAAIPGGTNSCGQSRARLTITQYLLLDYPGESDFIERVVSHLHPASLEPNQTVEQPLVVSFNGKSFDSQIIKTRCLMTGIKSPDYFHADLLHPARRLWKKTLPDCSQSTIEVSALGLDRDGDVSGVMAPDIWFAFLKNGENRELLSVCEHNVKDISGLATLFLSLAQIAAEPLESRSKFRCNEEALAFFWWKMLKRRSGLFWSDELYRNYSKTGEMLLEKAAGNGNPQAAVILAKNAEWHLRDFKQALRYTDMALANSDIPDSFREELNRRRCRLEGKLSFSALPDIPQNK